MSPPRVNLRSTAVKRIMQEARQLADPDTDDFVTAPLEHDIFEWHCTVRGVKGTDYEGGLYHLRILLPPSYPMSAPDIVLMTPNGRFELGKKICIDGLTSFHAGSWQPAWGVRTAITGLRAFWTQDGEALSAIGAIELPREERRRLAKLSRTWTCPTCRQSNIELLPDPVPGEKGSGSGSGSANGVNRVNGAGTPNGTSGTATPNGEKTDKADIAATLPNSDHGSPPPSANPETDHLHPQAGPSSSAAQTQNHGDVIGEPAQESRSSPMPGAPWTQSILSTTGASPTLTTQRSSTPALDTADTADTAGTVDTVYTPDTADTTEKTPTPAPEIATAPTPSTTEMQTQTTPDTRTMTSAFSRPLPPSNPADQGFIPARFTAPPTQTQAQAQTQTRAQQQGQGQGEGQDGQAHGQARRPPLWLDILIASLIALLLALLARR